MLYIKNERVFYWTAHPVGFSQYDLYNFNLLTRDPNADKGIIDFNFEALLLHGVSPEKNAKYFLEADFLSNTTNNAIETLLERTVSFFKSQGLTVKSSFIPLTLELKGLTLEDVINVIQNDEFQKLNLGLRTFSIWKMYLT